MELARHISHGIGLRPVAPLLGLLRVVPVQAEGGRMITDTTRIATAVNARVTQPGWKFDCIEPVAQPKQTWLDKLLRRFPAPPPQCQICNAVAEQFEIRLKHEQSQETKLINPRIDICGFEHYCLRIPEFSGMSFSDIGVELIESDGTTTKQESQRIYHDISCYD